MMERRTTWYILSRATLGHQRFAQIPMKPHKCPPQTDHGVPHDSTIARRGIRNETKHGQQLRLEIVIPEHANVSPDQNRTLNLDGHHPLHQPDIRSHGTIAPIGAF